MVRIKFKPRKKLGTVNFIGMPRINSRRKVMPRIKGYTNLRFADSIMIPRPTSVSIFSPSMKRPALKFYGDSDGDGVMNGFDCQPFNSRKQGPEHKRRGYLGVGEDLGISEKEGLKIREGVMNDLKSEDFHKKVHAAWDKENKLSAKDEYKYNQGALVMKPSKSKIDTKELININPQFQTQGDKEDAILATSERYEEAEDRIKRSKAEAAWRSKGSPTPEYDYEESLNKEEGKAEKISLQRHEDED